MKMYKRRKILKTNTNGVAFENPSYLREVNIEHIPVQVRINLLASLFFFFFFVDIVIHFFIYLLLHPHLHLLHIKLMVTISFLLFLYFSIVVFFVFFHRSFNLFAQNKIDVRCKH